MCDSHQNKAKNENRCSQCTSESEDSIKDQLMGCAESIRVGSNFGHSSNDDAQTCMPLSKFLENIMDMALTIIEILIICGVHECKARRTNDLIISSFIYFDEITSRSAKKFKKKIKKENFFSALATEVPMSGSDALLTYAITKYAFKAFYFKQTVKFYDPGFISECQWSKSVKKMFQAFVRLNRGSSCKHIQRSECLIKSTVEEYIQRVRRRGRKLTTVMSGDDCGNNHMNQIGVRPQRQSITACPICESMKKCNEGSTNPHQPCDMDKWIAWLNNSPQPFAQSAYNPSCQNENKVISGAEIKNACYTCLQKCNACENEPKSDCLNSPPCPCGPCKQATQSNCTQSANPCNKCSQPQKENCYPRKMPCCEPPKPCKLPGCTQQRSQQPCPCANKTNYESKCSTDQTQSSSSVSNPSNPCGAPCRPAKPINPCPKCVNSKTVKCETMNILWQSQPAPCPKITPKCNTPCGNNNNNNKTCGNSNNNNNNNRTCGNNTSNNCANNNNCGSLAQNTKCIPCISAYPKTCQEEYKQPKKIHEIKCCVKKLPNKRCPCGTKGARMAQKRKK